VRAKVSREGFLGTPLGGNRRTGKEQTMVDQKRGVFLERNFHNGGGVKGAGPTESLIHLFEVDPGKFQ